MAESPPAPSSRRTAKTPSIKGTVFKEFVSWYEQTRGREAALRAYGALAVELREQLDPDRPAFGLLPGSWYPVTIAGALLEEITVGLEHDARMAMLRSGVQHALGVTLTGVYRVLFETLVTPERHAKYAQKVWGQYYNTGTVVGAMVSPNRATQVVTDWEGHHPLLCELSLSSLGVFHEAMGCKNVRVRRTSCVLDAQLSAAHVARRTSSSSTRMRALRPIESGTFPPAPSSGSLVPACRFTIQWDA